MCRGAKGDYVTLQAAADTILAKITLFTDDESDPIKEVRSIGRETTSVSWVVVD